MMTLKRHVDTIPVTIRKRSFKKSIVTVLIAFLACTIILQVMRIRSAESDLEQYQEHRDLRALHLNQPNPKRKSKTTAEAKTKRNLAVSNKRRKRKNDV